MGVLIISHVCPSCHIRQPSNCASAHALVLSLVLSKRPCRLSPRDHSLALAQLELLRLLSSSLAGLGKRLNGASPSTHVGPGPRPRLLSLISGKRSPLWNLLLLLVGGGCLVRHGKVAHAAPFGVNHRIDEALKTRRRSELHRLSPDSRPVNSGMALDLAKQNALVAIDKPVASVPHTIQTCTNTCHHLEIMVQPCLIILSPPQHYGSSHVLKNAI